MSVNALVLRNVVGLFDGMSGLQIALKDMNIHFDTYYASEVDKHAIKQTQHVFPSTIQLGDITKWREWNIDWSMVDLIGAGSPCQGFSFAGKQLAFDDPRSKLFFVFIDILNHARKFNQNVLFLLENVSMKKEHMKVINDYCGVFPVNINSNLVSAQNRNRWYWTNIKTKNVGLFGELHSDIPQPADRGILLKDILESEVDEKYYLSDRMVQSLTDWGERNAQNGNGFKPEIKEVDEKSAVLTNGSMKSSSTYVKVDKKLNPKPNQNKASCFTAEGNSGGNHSDMDLICVAMRGRGEDNQQQLEPRIDQKTNSLTTVQKDNMIVEQASIKFGRTDEAKKIRRESMKQGTDYTPFVKKEIVALDFEKMNTLTTAINKDNLVMQINPSLESGGKQPYQQNRVYDSEGISPALCANKADLLIKQNYAVIGDGYEQDNRAYFEDGKSGTLDLKSESRQKVLLNNYRIRRLTPTECARLQTIPDWYTWIVSDTQQYKMLGNGWTNEVIKHILSFIH
jgi:DNA (cytosine-5)-methyltransferase 3A